MELAVSYDGLLTISSMLLAIISSLLSFWLLRFRKTSQRMLVLISLFMAIGICSMHFVGMHGMNLSANMMHDYRLVALAGVLAFSISYLSFLAFSRVKNRPYSLLHLPAALLMAAGVSATHYTAMASVTWIASESENHSIHSAVPNFVLNSDYMLMGIVIATFIFIAIMHSLLMMDKRKTEENMNYLAFHDNLTGLANRLQLTKHIEKAIRSSNQQELAIIYVDLDRFKIVNDTMGHDYGDELLIQASTRLRECVRKTDLVARQGGDEFIVLAKGVAREHAATIAKKIIHCFSKPFYLKGEEFFMSASVHILRMAIKWMS